MIELSKNFNPNYVAKIVKIDKLKEIEGANTIQLAIIDFNPVIVSKNVKLGDVMVFFPVESRLSDDVLASLNLYSDKSRNLDTTKGGFFEKNGRVRAVKMMKGSVQSFGFLYPLNELFEAFGEKIYDVNNFVGQEFDTILGVKIVEKYERPQKESKVGSGQKNPKSKNKLKFLLLDKQFKFHFQTKHFNRSLDEFNLDEEFVITRKMHGSSGIFANLLTNRKLTWFDKLAQYFGAKISLTSYSHIYSSGKPKSNLPKGVVSPKGDIEWINANKSYYEEDIWYKTYQTLKDKLEKGISIYGEIVGVGVQGKEFTYGIDGLDFFVYRITRTNADGIVQELTWEQVKQYCEKYELTHVEEYFQGNIFDFHAAYSVINEDTKEKFLEDIIQTYLDKSYSDCKFDEGICIRQDDRIWKLKSPKFLHFETKQLDQS